MLSSLSETPFGGDPWISTADNGARSMTPTTRPSSVCQSHVRGDASQNVDHVDDLIEQRHQEGLVCMLVELDRNGLRAGATATRANDSTSARTASSRHSSLLVPHASMMTSAVWGSTRCPDAGDGRSFIRSPSSAEEGRMRRPPPRSPCSTIWSCWIDPSHTSDRHAVVTPPPTSRTTRPPDRRWQTPANKRSAATTREPDPRPARARPAPRRGA